MTTENPVRSANIAVYAAIAIIAVIASASVAVYWLVAALPEAARLVLIGTCPVSFVVVGGVAANNIARGIGERIATSRPPAAPVIETQWRELPPPPQLAPAGPQHVALHYNAIPINYPPRNKRPAPPSKITTNGITVEVERLRKMLASPEPTRGAVQAMGAGIDNNAFASYRDFLISHHIIDAANKPARWALNYPNEFTRDEWLIGLLSTSPTTADNLADEN